jgi:hypothetical protein
MIEQGVKCFVVVLLLFSRCSIEQGNQKISTSSLLVQAAGGGILASRRTDQVILGACLLF